MSLSDDDIDRISDKVKIKIMEAFSDHEKKCHEGINKRVEVLENEKWYQRGFAAAISLFFVFILKIIGLFK